jgi:alpha-tubulin suppressor-like RCC1 family protein
VSHWKNIVAIFADSSFTVGVQSDGTVVATGFNKYGQCDVDTWKLFTVNPEADREKRKKEYHDKLILKRKETVSKLNNLSGPFKENRIKKAKEKIQEIDKKLENLNKI